jgi:lysophospholipid hydrolase
MITSEMNFSARHLTGTDVTLVLGGGGAKGCAHTGVIRALMEQGIPIDKLGGVSMGAIVGIFYW